VPADKTAEKRHYQSHSQTWFKTANGGRELAAKVFSLGAWHKLRQELLPFCNAVRKTVDLDEVADLIT
jgi:putative ATP-dependent endonuclease of the OLD family